MPPGGAIPEYQTLQPQDAGLRAGMDVHARFAHRVDDAVIPRTAGANTGNLADGGATQIEDSSSPARVGDYVRFEDGNAQYLELPIVYMPDADTLVLGARLDSALVPAAGDTFFIMRYTTQLVDETGAQQVNVVSGPIEYTRNGTATLVQEVTATPANSRPMPVKVMDFVGAEVDFATEAKQDSQITALAAANASLDAIEATDFATEAKQDTIILGLIAANASLDAIEAKDFATEATQAAMAADVALLEAKDFATETTLAAASAKLPATLGQKTMANSLAVVLASDQGNLPVSQKGGALSDNARKDYSGGSVTAAAWTQLIAATAAEAQGLTIFDSSGQTMELGVGAVASEVRVLIIPPGGLNGFIPLRIAAGSRVSVRAISATASVGELDLNLIGQVDNEKFET